MTGRLSPKFNSLTKTVEYKYSKACLAREIKLVKKFFSEIKSNNFVFSKIILSLPVIIVTLGCIWLAAYLKKPVF